LVTGADATIGKTTALLAPAIGAAAPGEIGEERAESDGRKEIDAVGGERRDGEDMLGDAIPPSRSGGGCHVPLTYLNRPRALLLT